MSAEDVGHGMPGSPHKVGQSPGARGIRGDLGLRNIKATRVQTVTRHQIASQAVIKRYAGIVVAWNRDDVDDAVSEVDSADVVRPTGHTGSLLNLRRNRGHELNIRQCLKLRIARGMVPV